MNKLKETFKQENIEFINNIAKESTDLNVGNNYNKVKIGIDYTNKIKTSK